MAIQRASLQRDVSLQVGLPQMFLIAGPCFIISSAWVWVRMPSGQPKVQMSGDFLQINASLGGAVAHTHAMDNTALHLGFLSFMPRDFDFLFFCC